MNMPKLVHLRKTISTAQHTCICAKQELLCKTCRIMLNTIKIAKHPQLREAYDPAFSTCTCAKHFQLPNTPVIVREIHKCAKYTQRPCKLKATVSKHPHLHKIRTTVQNTGNCAVYIMPKAHALAHSKLTCSTQSN